MVAELTGQIRCHCDGHVIVVLGEEQCKCHTDCAIVMHRVLFEDGKINTIVDAWIYDNTREISAGRSSGRDRRNRASVEDSTECEKR